MNKIQLVAFFGGRSAEHEVSVVSARNVTRAIDRSKYNVHLVGIKNSGDWVLLREQSIPEKLKRVDDLKAAEYHQVSLGVDQGKANLLFMENATKIAVDVAFPILHGSFGEDGTIQGLFRMCRLPFVGCGVIASAVGMDKEFMKRLLLEHKVPTARYKLLTSYDKSHDFDVLKGQLGAPFFIKPANAGSSVGVHKIKNAEDLKKGLADAFQYDFKVLAEEFMPGREIEIAVLGSNQNPRASLPGEIMPTHEFYSYEAKYIDADGAKLRIPAEMSPQDQKLVQELAITTYKILGCEGLTRVDFFMNGPGLFHVNEVNTLPGFTNISMYPKMWEASGVTYNQLIETLIFEAFERERAEGKLKTTFN